MRDVLGTIQADQDAIIRAGSRVNVAWTAVPRHRQDGRRWLRRAAYLLYSDPHLANNRGDVLVVGPHRGYLAYVDDVLPSLGEEGCRPAPCGTWSPRARRQCRRPTRALPG